MEVKRGGISGVMKREREGWLLFFVEGIERCKAGIGCSEGK